MARTRKLSTLYGIVLKEFKKDGRFICNVIDSCYQFDLITYKEKDILFKHFERQRPRVDLHSEFYYIPERLDGLSWWDGVCERGREIRIAFLKKLIKETKFVSKWGQSHEELCANLDYDEKDSDDLIMVDYFWYELLNVWIPINSSLYTKEEEKIANNLKPS